MNTLKYSKPEGFMGRGFGATNWRKFKWSVELYGEHVGKFVSIKDMNDQLGLDLNCDKVWRINTGKRVDMDAKKKKSSFISRYGHIKIEKINEYKEGICSYDTRKKVAANNIISVC
tara:strand:+ start:163 stop:510 length:348 start_codon:yes stop_codon:yes gene_type:complete